MKIRARWAISIVVTLVVGAITACNTSPASKAANLNNKSVQKAGGTDKEYHGINLNCVMDHIQNPTEAFHYSYHKQSSNPVEEDADITPQTIDGSFKNSSASHSFHGNRSDADGWHQAWSGLMGISGMSSAIALVRGGDAMVLEGTEKMNGYDTTRYSIDTGRATGAEQGLFRVTLGSGGFEKGMAWVTSEGCPVRMSIDSELHGNDGSVEKIHYEEAMVRK